MESTNYAIDLKLNIAVAAKRTQKKWKNKSISWADFIEKIKDPVRTKETIDEYFSLSKSDRSDIKDVGGFVGGLLKEGRRKNANVANRCMLTLDLDYYKASVDEFWSEFLKIYDVETVMYTTHSHKPDEPRMRLIIPTDRLMYADEYMAVSRMVAGDIGIEFFDDTTYEPERMMFWPSCAIDGDYVYKHNSTGKLLEVDEILDRYEDWHDVSQWPVSNRQSEVIRKSVKAQEDPLEKKGIIGAFCRTYTITDVLNKFLSEVYESTNTPGRYTYKNGSGFGGLVVYDDIFAYSHHGTDPCSGLLCNAFDLVRIHLYGDLDSDKKDNTPVNKLPSFLKMQEKASEDELVKATIGKEKLEKIEEDFEFAEEDKKEDPRDWINKLEVNISGGYLNTRKNIRIIMNNDPHLKGKLRYDSFSNRATCIDVPWRADKGLNDWSEVDDSGLRTYIETYYGISNIKGIDDCTNLVFNHNSFNPVLEYLKSIDGTWDGVKRIDTIFHDYLGAEDEEFSSAVAKIHLVAAVKRIFEPGSKYDTMVYLLGRQGIGKSTFVSYLAKDWFSDSLETVRGKEAYELLQGIWHVELGELSALKKADRDAVKAFLSKTHDIYRVAYGKHAQRFKRQCVFWGTTNETNMLRDPTGERRALPIDCGMYKAKKDIFLDMPAEVDQIWAEAVYLYKKGHPTVLNRDMEKIAVERQQLHKEDTPLKGYIEQYINAEYPSNWYDLTLYERQNYINGERDDPVYSDQMMQFDKICVMQIWVELFQKRPADLRPINSKEINDILRDISGWTPSRNPLQFGKAGYGRQRGFIRNM